MAGAIICIALVAIQVLIGIWPRDTISRTKRMVNEELRVIMYIKTINKGNEILIIQRELKT